VIRPTDSPAGRGGGKIQRYENFAATQKDALGVVFLPGNLLFLYGKLLEFSLNPSDK
jgi:hypothetical protein